MGIAASKVIGLLCVNGCVAFCLSLQKCQLYNKDDRMGASGKGPRVVRA